MAIASGYSSQVEIYLEVAGQRYPACRSNGDSVTLDAPRPAAFGSDAASVVIVIDGREYDHPVILASEPSSDPCVVAFRF